MILILWWLTFIISYSLLINVLFRSSLQVYVIIHVHTVYMHERLPFFLQLIRCLPDDLDLHVQRMFHVVDQVFDETGHVARSWSFSLPIPVLLSSFSFLLFLLFFWFSIHCYQSLFLFCIHMISCVLDIYMSYCSDIDLSWWLYSLFRLL